jgi:hypothetical protein
MVRFTTLKGDRASWLVTCIATNHSRFLLWAQLLMPDVNNQLVNNQLLNKHGVHSAAKLTFFGGGCIPGGPRNPIVWTLPLLAGALPLHRTIVDACRLPHQPPQYRPHKACGLVTI